MTVDGKHLIQKVIQTFQSPQNYHMPKNTVFFIDHVCIPVSWYSVQKGRNNKFYFKIGMSTLQIVEIPENNYKADTLVAELAKAISVNKLGPSERQTLITITELMH